MKHWRLWLTILLTLLLLAGLYQFHIIKKNWNKPSVNPYVSVYFPISAGRPLSAIAQDLEAAGAIQHANYFRWMARLHYGQHIKVGEYLLPPNATPAQIFAQLVEGKALQYAITFIDGWTFKQVKAALDAQPQLKHTLTNTAPKDILAVLGYAPIWPEGLFFPDTYFYLAGTSDQAILQRAYQTMQQHLDKAWRERAPGLPYDMPYQALIAASLIEKETSIAAEKPLVASVIVNRLRKNMPLQIDPTIIYGLGDHYTGRLTTQNMRHNTLYNTYLRRGLPPTPIAMPSEAAILAALHPAQTHYLYFVATGNGTHQFSDNLVAHDRAVKRYLQTLKAASTLKAAP